MNWPLDWPVKSKRKRLYALSSTQLRKGAKEKDSIESRDLTVFIFTCIKAVDPGH